MPELFPEEVAEHVDRVYRGESGRILSTLIRLLGDFALAEDYAALLAMQPSPVVELNRAAAVAMWEGPAAGLALVDAISARGDLRDYYLAHSARADLCRWLGRKVEARQAYERALGLVRSEPEKRFLRRRTSELE